MFRLATLSLLLTAAGSVSSAQFWPSPPEQAAKVITVVGQVSVMKDSQPWALNENDSIATGRLIISGPDGYALLQVADGSTFEVFPNSKVLFRSNPGNWKDLLDVLIGRVKVHIQQIGGQPNRNRITTPTAVISVRGTTFDVVVEEEDVTLVSVDEGYVEVQHALLPRGDPRILTAGDSLRIYKNEPLAKSRVDKGTAVQHGLRALAEAVYTVLTRTTTPRIPGGSRLPGGVPGGTPGGTIPGDTGAGAPPPPPPPPPPPAN